MLSVLPEVELRVDLLVALIYSPAGGVVELVELLWSALLIVVWDSQ